MKQFVIGLASLGWIVFWAGTCLGAPPTEGVPVMSLAGSWPNNQPQPFCGWGRINEKNKVFSSGIFHLRENCPSLKLGISGNSLPAGMHKLVINKDQWSRIVGLNRQELDANLREVK